MILWLSAARGREAEARTSRLKTGYGEVLHTIQVVVPDHRELDRGTLRAILRHAGTSVEGFERLLAG